MNGLPEYVEIIAPALLAGLVVLATHVPLGRQVLERGIIFIDLAVAQIAGLGVIVGHALYSDASAWQIQLCAFGAAITGALLLAWTERRWVELQEALIGISFVLAASAGVLVMSGDPHAAERLRDLLVGQVLWTSWSALGWMVLLSIAVLLAWSGCSRRTGRMGFYLLFAVTVTASVQLVGVYLVFASLIIPALAAWRMAARTGLVVGYAVGAAGYLAGLLLSAWRDWPAGAAIVCTMALVGLAMRVGVRRRS